MTHATMPIETHDHIPMQRSFCSRTANVGQSERWISLITGGGLALYGLTRGSLNGLLAAAIGGGLLYRGATGHCMAYEALGISTADRAETVGGVAAQRGVKVEKSILINRPAHELFQFWRTLENLPQVMDHLISVQPLEERRSHWVAKGAMDKTVEWDAEIINERENEMIAWQSLPGGDIATAGSVHFETAPNGRGTLLRVSMKYDPPAGKVGAAIASLLGQGLASRLDENLRQFKQLMEAGEIPTAATQRPAHVGP